jgi:hypothetical protein
MRANVKIAVQVDRLGAARGRDNARAAAALGRENSRMAAAVHGGVESAVWAAEMAAEGAGAWFRADFLAQGLKINFLLCGVPIVHLSSRGCF